MLAFGNCPVENKISVNGYWSAVRCQMEGSHGDMANLTFLSQLNKYTVMVMP